MTTRAVLLETLDHLSPWDGQEKDDLRSIREWANSGAPLCRIAKPDVPDPHLVSYFLVIDPDVEEMLLVEHRKSGGLLLPTGMRAGSHIDLSLWHLVRGDKTAITSFDEGEFISARWLSPQQVLDTQIGLLDPHMHRAVRKLQTLRA